MTDQQIEIRPEKGDIVRHLKSGTEYVFYGVSEKTLDGGEKIAYSTWLCQEEPFGPLVGPEVVLGGFDAVEFVERGAPREPGEHPVRPLILAVRGGRIEAAPGRLD